MIHLYSIIQYWISLYWISLYWIFARQILNTNTTNYLDNKLLIDDEEDARARASKIISQFKKAGLPLAYSGATFKAQIEQLTKLIKETNPETLDELVTLMCDTKIKVMLLTI